MASSHRSTSASTKCDSSVASSLSRAEKGDGSRFCRKGDIGPEKGDGSRFCPPFTRILLGKVARRVENETTPVPFYPRTSCGTASGSDNTHSPSHV